MEKIKRIRVTVAVRGDRLALIGHDGRLLSLCWMKAGALFHGELGHAKELRRWHPWAKRQIAVLSTRLAVCSFLRNPWERKINTWVVGCRLRLANAAEWLFQQRSPRRRTDRLNWDHAIKLMKEAAFNKVRRAERTEWEQWSITVANNVNKRKGGVYEREEIQIPGNSKSTQNPSREAAP